MRFVIIYATIEGQTKKIAQHIDLQLKTNQHACKTVLATATTNIAEFVDADGIIVCAPVHTGRFPKSIYGLLKRECRQLMSVPGAFVSVSLAVASDDADDAKEIDKIVHTMSEETGWWPVMAHNAAGALKYTQYDYFKKWMMKRISKKSGGPTDTETDYEFTDWAKLDKFITQFVNDVPAMKNKI